MVDEFKTIRDNLFKAITGLGANAGDESDDDDDDAGGPRIIDPRATRALLQALFARAGKGKDEVVQIIAREIGMAVAAMLKEPLSQLAKHQKLQISFEFVPKTPPAAASRAAATSGEDEEEEEIEEPEDDEEGEEAAEEEQQEDEEDEEEEVEAPSRRARAPRSRSSSRRKTSSKR